MNHEEIAKPTQAELAVLRILWDKGSSSVKIVHEVISIQKETGYTTTLKIMQNMLEKGLVLRAGSGRSHIYQPAVKEDDVQKDLLGNFMKLAFAGSTKNLVMQALGNHKTSKEEITEIRNLLDQIEQKNKY